MKKNCLILKLNNDQNLTPEIKKEVRSQLKEGISKAYAANDCSSVSNSLHKKWQEMRG